METISAVLSIIVINLILSGDNAIVIGMAAHRLEPGHRKAAIVGGGLAAIVLRIVLTVVAAALLQVPVLQLVGGLLLVWIAFRLLQQEEETAGVKVAGNLREAIVTILVADLVMSTDNVLGVAAASHGDTMLLIFGLVVSMAFLMFMGGLLATLIDRFWWLAYLGSAVIAWTGATMIFKDNFVQARLGEVSPTTEYSIAAVITLATLAFAHWFHRVRPLASTAGSETSGA